MFATSSTAARVRHAWPLLGLLLLAVLGCNRGLWTPDEPREAEISREMARSPSVIPTLEGRRFIEKPPLYYWVVAGIYDLTGGPSVLGARAVSVMAGFATLALLYGWGAMAHSRGAGLVAAFMLATSVQFMVSTHWVLLDPLLMLSTTLAGWAAWGLLAQSDEPQSLRWVLYLALVVALWIKGPIGPVLIGAGLLAFLVVDRPDHWRRLRPLFGSALLAAALLLLGWAIYSQGGRAALWEWAYVNHVQRLINPGATGHQQPPLYYGWTLPYTLLPWLPALLQALRPVHWRRGRVQGPALAPDPARYGAIMGAGMVLLLSVSSTKRETYLLPLLPLLFLWLGIRSYQWWQAWRRASGPHLGALWWAQVGLLCLYAVLAPVAAWVWMRTPSVLILVGLGLALGPVVALLYLSAHAARRAAGICALVTALVGSAVLLSLAPPLLNGTKDLAPFMRALGRRLPPGQAVFAVHVDETLAAEVPFYTDRAVIALDPRTLAALIPQATGAGTAAPVSPALVPDWVLVQDYDDGHDESLPPAYMRVMYQSFGSGRSLALWRAELIRSPGR